MDRHTATQGYRELRALAEELLAAPDGAQRDRLIAAISIALLLHCRECGALLDRMLRDAGDEFCYACVLPSAPSARRPPPDDGDGDGDVPF